MRIANISLIKAKEEAFLALQKAKQNLALNSDNTKDADIRVLPSDDLSSVNTNIADVRGMPMTESSVVTTSSEVHLEGISTDQCIIYFPLIKDEDSLLEH